jgi:hypothetical protein
MNVKKLVVVAIAGAFALPLAGLASAAGDTMIRAQGPSGTSSVGSGPTGGTPSPQSAGEPKAPMADSKADTRRCESMTGLEREFCMRDARAPGATTGTTGSATGGATTSSGGPVTSGASGTAGTQPSDRAAPGSATATKPDTSGTGKAQ